MKRIGSTREDWPFQPWPEQRGSTLSGWSDDSRAAATARPVIHKWLLLTLIPVLVVGLAGAAVAHLVADEAAGESSPRNNLDHPVCLDRHVAALLLEHRAVRGL
jgi:hypothetical protein